MAQLQRELWHNCSASCGTTAAQRLTSTGALPVCLPAAPLERNLIPAEASQVQEEFEPLPVQVVSAGAAYPHPDKVKNDKAKAVNTKHYGYGGEDAYFHITGK